jgi:hypothetical protein
MISQAHRQNPEEERLDLPPVPEILVQNVNRQDQQREEVTAKCRGSHRLTA